MERSHWKASQNNMTEWVVTDSRLTAYGDSCHKAGGGRLLYEDSLSYIPSPDQPGLEENQPGKDRKREKTVG